MKRTFTLILALVLMIGIIFPSASLAAGSKPKTPSFKSATPGTHSVSLAWNAVKGADGYEIAYGRKGSPDALDTHVIVYGTSLNVTGLSNEATYVFRIRAFYKSGTSMKNTSWSSRKSVTTISVKPSKPQNLSGKYANGKVTLTWKTDSRAKGYEVAWYEKGSALNARGKDVHFTGSAVIDERIVTGTMMVFKVRAYWYEGKSIKYTSWSQKEIKTKSAAPAYTISKSFNCPDTLKQGKGYGLRGIIKVNEKITQVSASVTQTGGSAAIHYFAKPNTSTFDVTKTKGSNGKSLNDTMVFNNLPKGNYVYKVNIMFTEKGQNKCYYYEHKFTIK